MNFILLQEGYPLAIIQKEDRLPYIRAIEKYRQSDDGTDFSLMVCKSAESSIDSYLQAIE